MFGYGVDMGVVVVLCYVQQVMVVYVIQQMCVGIVGVILVVGYVFMCEGLVDFVWMYIVVFVYECQYFGGVVMGFGVLFMFGYVWVYQCQMFVGQEVVVYQVVFFYW